MTGKSRPFLVGRVATPGLTGYFPNTRQQPVKVVALLGASPTGRAPLLTIPHGQGRLTVQTLLPEQPRVALRTGPDLYRYDGQEFAPQHDTGPAPQCRIEISPALPRAFDCFLHVLTATDAEVAPPPRATLSREGGLLRVQIGTARLILPVESVGGELEWAGGRAKLGLGLPPGAAAR